jgi:isopenicillin-N N-acyltransferase-like protein
MESLRIVAIGGSPGDRGEQHGRALGPLISHFYEQMIEWGSAGSRPFGERDVLGQSLGLLAESRAQTPELVAEVEAIADSAGIAFEKVWLLNCFDQLGQYWYPPRACTTFAATGRSTVDGRTLSGQNWDMTMEWLPPILLRVAGDDAEGGALVFTHPGVVGGMGINGHGVSIVWNSMMARDTRLGVPVPFLIRRALSQSKLSGAITAVLRPVRAIGFNFVLASPDGAANVEATAQRQHVTYIGSHLAHGNHYEAPALVAYEADPSYGSSTFVRSGRMNQLLDESAGRIDVEVCKQMLRDHAHYPGSVCAHPDPPSAPTNLTLASMVVVPAERRLLITEGPPCQGEYLDFRVE